MSKRDISKESSKRTDPKLEATEIKLSILRVTLYIKWAQLILLILGPIAWVILKWLE